MSLQASRGRLLRVSMLSRATQLGDDSEPAAVVAWRAAVAARGHRVTRIPTGRPNAGELAEAAGSDPYNTRNVTYTLAPAAVRQADGHYSAELQSQIEAGNVADAVTSILAPVAAIGGAVLEAPRDAVAAAIGIPQKWSPLVAVGLLAAGGVVLYRMAKR